MLRVSTSDMFRSEAVVIEDAYNKRGHQIAYQEENSENASKVDQIDYDASGVAE